MHIGRRPFPASGIVRIQANEGILRRLAVAFELPAGSMFPRRFLVEDFGDDSSTHRATTFANSEAQSLLHGDRHNQFHFELRVVTRHDHLAAFWQVNDLPVTSVVRK